jgi:hypothetical protein
MGEHLSPNSAASARLNARQLIGGASKQLSNCTRIFGSFFNVPTAHDVTQDCRFIVVDGDGSRGFDRAAHRAANGRRQMSVAGRRSPPKKASQMPKVVNLALQGGGSHGAFTWGVLDRLLQEERLSFEGISATSAGAVNAVVLADGLAAGGREGARDALRVYWQKVSALSARGIFKPSSVDKGNSDFGLEHSLGFWFLKMTYLTSPYQMNPLNHNPLKNC